MIDLLGGGRHLHHLATFRSRASQERRREGPGHGGAGAAPDAAGHPDHRRGGVPGLELVSWYAVYAPAGTPQDIVDKLAAAMEKIATSTDYKQKMEQGAYATFMGPKELGEFTKAELVYWGGHQEGRHHPRPVTRHARITTKRPARPDRRRPPLGSCQGRDRGSLTRERK